MITEKGLNGSENLEKEIFAAKTARNTGIFLANVL